MERNGFSLIELMIAVAIVAILASIAYPSYQEYIVKSRRGEAQSILMDIAQRQRQYLLDRRSYAANLATLNYTVPTDVTRNYDVTFATTAGPPPTFTITATPKSGTSQAGDVVLTINHQGVKTPAEKW